MSDEKRQAERAPIGLRVRLRFADMESFVAGYAANISRNGVYLEGVAPRATDTLVRFELLLADGTVALRGEGKVIWSRTEGTESGIALRFTRLESRSKALIDDLVARSRVGAGSIPPPPPARPIRAPSIAGSTEPTSPRPPLGSAVEPAPMRVQITPARASRPSLVELDQQLDALERETFERITGVPNAPSAPRASMVDLERELDELGSHVPPPPRVSREPLAPARPAPPPAAPRVSVPPPVVVRSIAPPIAASDIDDLPPIFGLLGDDGEVHSAIEHAPAPIETRSPVVSERAPVPAASAPEPMREPTPVPSEPPEEIDPEEDDEDTSLTAIPQAPLLPAADVAASAALDLDLPNLELEMPEEPVAHEPAPVASSEAPKRRSLLGKLLGR